MNPLTAPMIVRSGRNPFQIALLAVCLAAGISGLALPPPGPSANIAKVFGPTGAVGLYLALAVSAALGLAGMAWQRRHLRAITIGLQIERAGLSVLVGAAGAYALTNLVASGLPALIAVLLITGISVASAVRARQISNDLRELLALPQPEDPAPDSGG